MKPSVIILICFLLISIVGATTSYHYLTRGYADTLYCSLGGACNIASLNLTGNFSAKRAYWNGYENSTQLLVSTTAAQVINISNNNDYDAYLIAVEGRQNLTFSTTGDYLCILSPEFYNSAATANVGFWYQKTNSTGQMNDVAWSNSRYRLANGEYNAPAIPFQFDITNTANDKIRFMWNSDNANTQIISLTGLTNPVRPSIPGIILNCAKVSEIT